MTNINFLSLMIIKEEETSATDTSLATNISEGTLCCTLYCRMFGDTSIACSHLYIYTFY